jgi:hypothetical protein
LTEAELRDQCIVVALDDCIQWIVSLVEREDPNAVRLSIAEADAYLASFDEVRGIKTRRNELVTALRRELPRTPQADQILEAIDRGSGEDEA